MNNQSAVNAALSAVSARVNLSIVMLENGMIKEAVSLLRRLSSVLPHPTQQNIDAALSQAKEK